MIWFIGAILFAVFGTVGNAMAADCVIVGDNAVYRIADCVENQTDIPVIRHNLGSNYAIVTDRKDGKLLAVFLAETSRKTDNDAPQQNQEISDQSPRQFPDEQQYRKIEFPIPIPLSSADQTLDDLRSQGQIPAQFMVSFGEYQVLYDLAEEDTITSILDRERSNLLDLLDRQKQAILEQSSESSERSLQMVEQGRAALLNNDVVLKSVFVLPQ